SGSRSLRKVDDPRWEGKELEEAGPVSGRLERFQEGLELRAEGTLGPKRDGERERSPPAGGPGVLRRGCLASRCGEELDRRRVALLRFVDEKQERASSGLLAREFE